jgi:hypothetical protein
MLSRATVLEQCRRRANVEGEGGAEGRDKWMIRCS